MHAKSSGHRSRRRAGLGALVIVHLTPVPFVDQGGWELVAALAAGALLIAAAGPGRLSIDRLLFTGGKNARGKQNSASRSVSAVA